MLRVGRVFPLDERARVRGIPVPLVKTFHCCFGIAHIDLFPDQSVGGAVEIPFHLDVVIDVHSGDFPLRILVKEFRQREHCQSVQFLEAAPAGAGEFLEVAVVQ